MTWNMKSNDVLQCNETKRKLISAMVVKWIRENWGSLFCSHDGSVVLSVKESQVAELILSTSGKLLSVVELGRFISA